MAHQVLSRKYRPKGFDELVGQDHVGRILRNAIKSGRIGHAYLFVGPRGVGKTTTARIFARALNCSAGAADVPVPDPCGTCASCLDITAGVDLDVVEMDAASNNHVEDVRRLREQVGYATVRSRFRIWIVDEVHMLSMPAFNAFLKTLEEPPESVKFIFCTTEEHKLPDTFRSRCQRIEFRPIDTRAMAARLEDLAAREGVEVEDGLCTEIAAGALGGLRDAESLLEQLVAACPDACVGRADLDALAGRAPGALLDRLHEAIAAQDAGAALEAVDAALATGCKPGVLIEQWMERLRRDLVAAATSTEGGGSVARVARSLDVLLEKRMHLRSGADGGLVCQVAAVELARLPDARDLDRLIKALEGGGSAPTAPAVQQAVSPKAVSPKAVSPKAVLPKAASPKAVLPKAASPKAVSPKAASPKAASPKAVSPRARSAAPAASKSTARSAPAAVPPKAAPATIGKDEVVGAWDALLAAASSADARLAHALGRARPGDVVEGRLDLHVGRDDVLARSTLERREAMLAFRRLTQQVLGVSLAPRVQVDAREALPPEPAAEPASEHPTVRRVREITGGRLLGIEEGQGIEADQGDEDTSEGEEKA